MGAGSRCAVLRGALALLAASAAAALGGCTYVPVQIDYQAGRSLSTNRGAHLYRVAATRIGALWLKPGVHFADYGSVSFRESSLAYAQRPRMATSFDLQPGNFRLRLNASDRIRRDLRATLAREIARGGDLRVTEEPEADGIVVHPHIVGLRWEVPPARGSERLFVRRTGEMIVVLDLRSAVTGELLARIADGRVIRPSDVGLGGRYESSPVNNWAGVRDVCSLWGLRLRATLDTLRALPPMPAPGEKLADLR
jgi:hypothetical protein